MSSTSPQNRLQERVDEISTDYYSSLSPEERERKAYFHVAVKYLLFSYDLSDEEIDEEIIQQIETDRDDGGIDFFYVSEDDRPKVYVVQVKHEKKFPLGKQKEAINKMQAEIDLLKSRQKSTNLSEKRKDRFRQLKDAYSNDPQYLYVLFLTGGPKAKATVDDFAKGQYDNETNILKVFDRDGLLRLIESTETPPSVTSRMRLDKKTFVPINKPGEYRWCYGLATIKDYVDATKGLGDDLFALNPRLFLSASAGPNKSMKETLGSPTERKNFHFYNNGITAVCKRQTLESDSGSFVTVLLEGLRVVNGCQTTETLWSWVRDNQEAAEKTKLMVRIIESADDEDLNLKISRTTNSQSAILASDLIANDENQKRLKAALQNSAPRHYFYENRRGEWRKATAHTHLQALVPHGEWGENTSKQYRKITLREMAQALQSVCGLPEQAKEGIANLFKPGNSRYSIIFKESWTDSEQVLLVADLYRYLSRKENWLPASATEEQKTLAGLSRYYLCHLIYETWKGGGRPSFNNEELDNKLIDAENSKRIRNNFLSEIGKLPWVATVAIETVLSDPNLQIDGKRALLRTSGNRPHIQQKFKALRDINI